MNAFFHNESYPNPLIVSKRYSMIRPPLQITHRSIPNHPLSRLSAICEPQFFFSLTSSCHPGGVAPVTGGQHNAPRHRLDRPTAIHALVASLNATYYYPGE